MESHQRQVHTKTQSPTIHTVSPPLVTLSTTRWLWTVVVIASHVVHPMKALHTWPVPVSSLSFLTPMPVPTVPAATATLLPTTSTVLVIRPSRKKLWHLHCLPSPSIWPMDGWRCSSRMGTVVTRMEDSIRTRRTANLVPPKWWPDQITLTVMVPWHDQYEVRIIPH